LAPPALPGFSATMTLSEAQTSRHPAGDVRSSTADSGLPLLPQDTFSTCRAHYPGGLSRCFSVGFYAAPRASFFPRHAGLPGPNIRSASTVQLFEACSSFTRVTARRFAHPPDVGLVGRLRHRPLPGGIASQLHRHTETSCGGTCTHWWSCAISAHIGFVWFSWERQEERRPGGPRHRGLGSFGAAWQRVFHARNTGDETGGGPVGIGHVVLLPLSELPRGRGWV
jgi:hypothetical protein